MRYHLETQDLGFWSPVKCLRGHLAVKPQTCPVIMVHHASLSATSEWFSLLYVMGLSEWR